MSTEFQGREPTPTVTTFIRTATTTPVKSFAAKLESKLNVEKIIKFCIEPHPHGSPKFDKSRLQARQLASRSQLPKFEKIDYVLVPDRTSKRAKNSAYVGEDCVASQRRCAITSTRWKTFVKFTVAKVTFTTPNWTKYMRHD